MTTDNVTIVITADSDPENPRDWDNLGTMAAFHQRYRLGDTDHGIDHRDYSSWDEMEAAIIRANPGCVILPLYLYDHSGIRMNTSGFHCPWDSGQVGFIFVSAKNSSLKTVWYAACPPDISATTFSADFFLSRAE